MAPERNNRAIDWAAVGLLAVEWLIAIVEFTFIVLLGGLIFGYFGTFVDFVAPHIVDGWPSHGREWGWILGAAATAIGLPIGWVRKDGKRFSFPSPRSLRNKVAARVPRKHVSKKELHQYQRPRDVLKLSAMLGFTGAFLGFLLGMHLLMGWFSLALSPFGTDAWFESIEFGGQVDPISSDGLDAPQSTSMSSNNPVVLYLVMVPIAILGVVGMTAGLTLGSWSYRRYLIAVPPEVRAEHKRARREPIATQQEATRAATEQGLTPLSPAPRDVPLSIRWQIVNSGIGVGLVGGVACFLIATVCVPMIFYLAEDPNARLPLVMLGTVFTSVGTVSFIGCLVAYRKQVDILRNGFLARATVVKCKDANVNRWKDFETTFDEFYRAWHKPLVSKKDLKQFKAVGWTMTVLVALIAAGFFSVGSLVVWTFRREGWMVMVPIGMLVFGVVFFSSIVRQLTRFRSIGRAPASMGVEPLLDCQCDFPLPNRSQQRIEAKVNFARRLATGIADPDEVIVYHPVTPNHALALSGFRPALEVDDRGAWILAEPPSTKDKLVTDALVYVAPNGNKYHEQSCQYAGQNASAVPLTYAKRFYEPCGACNPHDLANS